VEEEKSAQMRSLVARTRKLRNEYRRLKGALEARDRRQEGNAPHLGKKQTEERKKQRARDGKGKEEALEEMVYDWIVDVSLLGDLSKQGWRVDFSKAFYAKYQNQQQNSLGWEGAVVAVVGLYDKVYVSTEILSARIFCP
jgi:hypothetical protein